MIQIIEVTSLKVQTTLGTGKAAPHMAFKPRGKPLWLSVLAKLPVDKLSGIVLTVRAEGDRPLTSQLGDTERETIDRFQRHLPLVAEPYRAMAEAIGMEEPDLLAILADLEARKVISSIGAIVAPDKAGASTLAAMSVPAYALDEVAGFVSAIPEINHNCEREHRLNLWFVVAAADRAKVMQVLRNIEYRTSIPVIELPLPEAFNLDAGLEVDWH